MTLRAEWRLGEEGRFTMNTAFQKNAEAFMARRAEFDGQIGKFVLFFDGTFVGVFDAYADALHAGYDHDPDGHFYVKRITPPEQIAFFTRDLGFSCQP
jgi:hypothetical protein